MKKNFLYAATAALLFTGAGFTSCSDDDDTYIPDGNAKIVVTNQTMLKDFVQSGTFDPIPTGQSVTITFNAGKGQGLMFASMYGNSNDIFIAPENAGIELFNENGTAVTGDVSGQLKLWDNGTRVNQAPGSNVTHPGTAETQPVTMIVDNDREGHPYLAASSLMKATLEYNSTTSQFTLTLTNTSAGTANETPFSRGVWVVSNMLDNELVNGEPFFIPGERAPGQITTLAEAGNPEPLATWAAERTGIVTNFSAVVMVTYTGETNPIYQLNQPATAGLKTFSQTGNVDQLKAELERARNVRRVYIVGSDPVKPGEQAESLFEAYEGDHITFVVQFKNSNDWFYTNSQLISATHKGDVTASTVLLDSGSAVSQYPGAGNSQFVFGGTAIAENNPVSAVGTMFPVPPVNEIIKVTLQ